MNNLKFLIAYFIITITSFNRVFAEENTGLLNWIIEKEVDWKKMSGVERIRTWEIHLDDIPNVIHSLINTFIWIAWTVSVVFVIVWAYKVLFGSFENEHTKWRDTIVMAITGFAISVLAWFIVKFVFDNFG